MSGGKLQIRRRFRFSVKESEGGYVSFTADGGDIKISGVTTDCRDRECVKQLVRRMIKAPETPPYRVRYMAEAVLQHLLQMANEVGWRSSVSAGASIYVDDLSGSELTLDVKIAYGAPPKVYHSEEDYYFDDHEDEWYAAISSCYCGFETHYDVEKILYFGREYEGDDNPLRFGHNQHMLRRAVITTVKQAYNAGP
jgi:hypothetical protein